MTKEQRELLRFVASAVAAANLALAETAKDLLEKEQEAFEKENAELVTAFSRKAG